MKQKTLIFLLRASFLGLTLLASQPVLSGGIPTTDVAAVTTMIQENMKTLEELRKQLDAVNRQIEQAKQFAQDEIRRFEGNLSLNKLISNDDFLSSLPKEAVDILLGGSSPNAMNDLRNQYGLATDDPIKQKEYDALIKKAERTKASYKSTQKHIKNLGEIKKEADNAKTPSQKADVANKIAYEQLLITQEQLALRQLEESAKAEEELAVMKEKKEYMRQLEAGREQFFKRLNTK